MTIKVAHLTTVDMSVRHLLLNQILALKHAGFDVTALSAPGPDLGPVLEAERSAPTRLIRAPRVAAHRRAGIPGAVPDLPP